MHGSSLTHSLPDSCSSKLYCSFLSLFSQLKQYTEDFERERVAREEAVKVKTIVEDNLQKKDREITSLREQINRHAQQQVSMIRG